eukprot:15458319-Alexandrium_andersonii.AAC.1
MQHSYNLDARIDLTCCDGVLLMHAMRSSMPYFGVCFSAEHKDALRTWTAHAIFDAFQTKGDDLFQAPLAEILGVKATGGEKKAAGKKEGG